MQHHPWEQELMEEGWEALGPQHLRRVTKYFVMEALSVSNFEECTIDLNIFFQDGLSVDEEKQSSLELPMQNFVSRFFESEEWTQNWGWHEDGKGMEVIDIGESYEQLSKFLSKEQELRDLLSSDRP